MSVTVDDRHATYQGEALPVIIFLWVNRSLRMAVTMSLASCYRARNGAHHQVYLLGRRSLVEITRLKWASRSPDSAHTPDLSLAVSHRERTVV